jgi:hypothetical protein
MQGQHVLLCLLSSTKCNTRFVSGVYLLGESCPSIHLSIINQRKKLRIKSGKSQKKKIFLKIVSHT